MVEQQGQHRLMKMSSAMLASEQQHQKAGTVMLYFSRTCAQDVRRADN